MPKLALTLQFPAAKTFPEHKALLPRATVASWIKASLFADAELTVRFVDTEEGRTLNHAFIILDEAQNTTPEQMKMFLTRIGFGSKAVVTGDTTQVDLPRGHRSGLIEAQHILADVRGIAMTKFTSVDVVRHPLVARIVEAYDAQSQRDAVAANASAGK